ncbi:MAG: hypothetical protein HFJ09_05305 [Lachnospiraceae bacterium]|nr:hypothetical protein [Lachnospiraceae bacterium]
MEELFTYAILFDEGLISKDDYQHKLDKLFLENPFDDVLLDLEYMQNIQEHIPYIRANFNYNNFNHNVFGRTLMEKLKEYYENVEIHTFADRMWLLWESLPGNIQDEEPFHTLSYADDWGDEVQAKEIYENMLNYYNRE